MKKPSWMCELERANAAGHRDRFGDDLVHRRAAGVVVVDHRGAGQAVQGALVVSVGEAVGVDGHLRETIEHEQLAAVSMQRPQDRAERIRIAIIEPVFPVAARAVVARHAPVIEDRSLMGREDYGPANGVRCLRARLATVERREEERRARESERGQQLSASQSIHLRTAGVLTHNYLFLASRSVHEVT